MSIDVKKTKVFCDQADYETALYNGEIMDQALYYVRDDSPYIRYKDLVSQKSEINLDYDKIFEAMVSRFNKMVPTVEHKCHNCGGTLEINANQGIFKCPYCRSVYAIGTLRINDRN